MAGQPRRLRPRSPSVTHTRAPRCLVRATPHGGPRARASPSSPVTARAALSHRLHPLTPDPQRRAPAQRGRSPDGVEQSPRWRLRPRPLRTPGGVRAPPHAGALAPEAQLKIARPNYIWCGRIQTRPRAPRPNPPRPPGSPAPHSAEWRRGGGDRGGTYSAICSARRRRGPANLRI